MAAATIANELLLLQEKLAGLVDDKENEERRKLENDILSKQQEHDKLLKAAAEQALRDAEAKMKEQELQTLIAANCSSLIPRVYRDAYAVINQSISAHGRTEGLDNHVLAADFVRTFTVMDRHPQGIAARFGTYGVPSIVAQPVFAAYTAQCNNGIADGVPITLGQLGTAIVDSGTEFRCQAATRGNGLQGGAAPVITRPEHGVKIITDVQTHFNKYSGIVRDGEMLLGAYKILSALMVLPDFNLIDDGGSREARLVEENPDIFLHHPALARGYYKYPRQVRTKVLALHKEELTAGTMIMIDICQQDFEDLGRAATLLLSDSSEWNYRVIEDGAVNIAATSSLGLERRKIRALTYK